MAPKHDMNFALILYGEHKVPARSRLYSLKPGWNQVYIDFARDFPDIKIDEIGVMSSMRLIINYRSPIGLYTEAYVDNLKYYGKSNYDVIHENGFGWERGQECIYPGSVADGGDRVFKEPILEKGPLRYYYCSSKHYDHARTGWGFENNQSCLVKGSPAEKQLGGEQGNYDDDIYDDSNHPLCTPNAVDPDGDGLGWENNQTCRIPNYQGKVSP